MARFVPPLSHFFLATLPPPDVRQAIEDTVALARSLWRRVDDDRLHVTLLGLGASSARPEAMIREWIRAIDAAPPEAFHIVVDQLIVRPERVLVKGSEPLLGVLRCQTHLREVLAGAAMRRAGAPLPVAHITLAYACSARPGAVPILPVSWRATEVVLIQSLVGHRTHRHLARWILA